MARPKWDNAELVYQSKKRLAVHNKLINQLLVADGKAYTVKHGRATDERLDALTSLPACQMAVHLQTPQTYT